MVYTLLMYKPLFIIFFSIVLKIYCNHLFTFRLAIPGHQSANVSFSFAGLSCPLYFSFNTIYIRISFSGCTLDLSVIPLGTLDVIHCKISYTGYRLDKEQEL